MTVRRLVVIVIALLLAVQVVRNAAVAQLSDFRPELAARFWAAHPDVELSLGMTEIAEASRRPSPVSAASIALIDSAARKAPLAPEPYLVHGVQAQLAGKADAAVRDFQEAQRREPRSLPAAYFLANAYLLRGNAEAGLKQAAVLARLSPGGQQTIAPYVATYAKNPSNWPQIKAFFRSEPGIEDEVLIALAHDPSNAAAVLALADADHRSASSAWLPVLLQGLVQQGRYVDARDLWASVAHAQDAGSSLVYDPAFDAPGAPAPFNWSFSSGGTGIAERLRGGGLHVIFYGQQDGVLASELLVLAPGTYRLSAQLAPGATRPEALSWSIRCDKAEAPFATVSLSASAGSGLTFTVPQSCAAQWIELSGKSGDVPQQSEATIRKIALRRSGAHG